jgi:hypothetical protein
LKYIFVAGAPGSKWSSVVKNIYYSPSINRTDYSDERTYYHDASGEMQLMHLGAYFDPGMEFGLPESMLTLSKKQAESLFDKAFTENSEGVRIIKSHIFCYYNNIRYLQEVFPESRIVLVHRNDDSCLGWWVKCGHFNITYPSYAWYYRDLKHMAKLIKLQNEGLTQAWNDNKGTEVYTNLRLALNLGIDSPPIEYNQNYMDNDIRVKII